MNIKCFSLTLLLCLLLETARATDGYLLYLSQEKRTISLTPNLEYSLPLFISSEKDWSFELMGKIHTDYDLFNNELKTYTFTTIGFHF